MKVNLARCGKAFGEIFEAGQPASSRRSESGEWRKLEGRREITLFSALYTLSQLGAISSKVSLLSSMDEFMFRFKQHSVYLPSALMS